MTARHTNESRGAGPVARSVKDHLPVSGAARGMILANGMSLGFMDSLWFIWSPVREGDYKIYWFGKQW